MNYFYRFEQMLDDFSLSLASAESTGTTPLAYRPVWLSTNFEQPVPFAACPLGTAGVSTPLPGGLNYEPVAGITHSELRITGEDGSQTLDITLPLDHPVALLFGEELTTSQVYVIVGKQSPLGGPARVHFSGVIANATTDGLVKRLKVIALTELLKNASNTRTYGASCGHSLFEPYGCRVNSEATDGAYFKYREDGHLAAAVSRTATTIVVPEGFNRPNGFFNLGYVLIEPLYGVAGCSAHVLRPDLPAAAVAPYGGIRRSIHRHQGNQITLDSFLLKAFPAGSRVTLYAGCDQSKATCLAKFNNLQWFGGYCYYNGKNPFESGLMV